MLNRVLAYAAVGVFAGSMTVWGADAPTVTLQPGPAEKAAESKPAAPQPAKAEARAPEQQKSWVQQNLETIETEMARIEKQVGATADADAKAAGHAALAAGKDMSDLLHQAQAAMTAGGRRAAEKYRAGIEDMRKAGKALQRKFDLLMENARYEAMAAEATADADLKALADSAVKANLEIIDMETRLAKRLAEKQQLDRLMQQRHERPRRAAARRMEAGKRQKPATKEGTAAAAPEPAEETGK